MTPKFDLQIQQYLLSEGRLAEYFDLDVSELRRVALRLGTTLLVILTLIGVYNYDKLSSEEKEQVIVLRDNPRVAEQLAELRPDRPVPPIENNINATPDEYYEHFVREEGLRNQAYLDTSGNATVGIGHYMNGTARDRELFMQLFPNSNYDDILYGREELTNEQVRVLFNHDLQEKLALAGRLISEFENLPAYVQVAIVDGVFRGDLSGSPETLRLINAEEWDLVAGEYINNDEYRNSQRQGARHGVWQRMDRNAEAFRRYAEELNARL